jgi:hypothetical protein
MYIRLYNTPADYYHTPLKSELNAFLKKIQEKPAISSILLELDSQASTLEPTPFHNTNKP